MDYVPTLDLNDPVRIYSPMRMNKQSSDTLDYSVELFKAFADPVRMRLLNLLTEGEVCVCHLHEALDLPQSYDSPAIWRISEGGDWCLDGRKAYGCITDWLKQTGSCTGS